MTPDPDSSLRLLAGLHTATAALAAAPDASTLLEEIARQAADLIDAPAACLFLRDGDVFVPRAGCGLSAEYLATQRLKAALVDAAWQALGGQPIAVFDLQVVPFGNPELIAAERLRSALAAPLDQSGVLLGTLIVYSRDEPRAFTPEEGQTLRVLGRQAAALWERTRAVAEAQRRAQQEEAIGSIVQTVTSAGALPDVLYQAIATICRTLGADSGSLWSYDPETRLLQSEASYGFPVDLSGTREPLGNWPHVHQAIARGEPVVLEQPAAGEMTYWQRLGIRQAVAAPMVARGATIGVLFVNLHAPAAFGATALAFLRAAAGSLATAIDSARLAALAAQRAAELEATFESLVDAVAVADATGQITYLNRRWRELRGEDIEAGWMRTVTGQPTDAVYRRLDGSAIAPEDFAITRALRGERVEQSELEVAYPSGRRLILSTSAAPILAADGLIAGAVAISRDVTELKRLERTKDEFISIASHELRTPITGIKGFAQRLLRRLQRDDGQLDRQALRQDLQRIDREADRLVALISDLLDVNRLRGGWLEFRPRPTDLGTLVREAAARFDSDSAHPWRLELPDQPLVGSWDPERLDQVLENLFENARKYSPRGGPIVVSLGAEPGWAHLVVRDAGIGFPPEEAADLFQIYYRTPSSITQTTGGLGLGLYISRSIVERLGGQIWAESPGPGQGSAFHVRLPLQ